MYSEHNPGVSIGIWLRLRLYNTFLAKTVGKGLYGKNVRLKYEFVDVVRNTSMFKNVTHNTATF